ncbi:MAG: hypothetical protein HRU19_03950 [Pseudobacteriovorax sp.]|nr:hypothetical protein [Pseudobacteriovorax sp.]
MKIIGLLLCVGLFACQSGGGADGMSSSPINAKEETRYKQALLKCYKTGGSRIVKIEGKLRCY